MSQQTSDPQPVPSKSTRMVMASDDEGEDDFAQGQPLLEDVLAEFPDDTEVRLTSTSRVPTRLLALIQEIDLARSRLASCAHLGLPRFRGHLKNLCLRGNYITTLDKDVFGPLEHLEELDLYDNRIKQLGEALDGRQSLRQVSKSLPLRILMSSRVLDLSFNLLRAVPVELLNIPALQVVYFVQNKITRIEHLGHLGASLRSLELGSNRIRVCAN